MIHHSALSRKRLRSMKILDKSSCYVTALNDQLSNREIFDRFGKVLSFRVLKDTDPKQLYVRYTEEASAVNAVAWCSENPSVFEDAKHGFNRYCSKFIHGKQCRNKACENRHFWAETENILPFRVPNAPQSLPLDGAVQYEHVQSDCKSTMTSSRVQSRIEHNMIALQDRFIDDLLREINDLRNSNVSLKQSVTQLYQQNCQIKQDMNSINGKCGGGYGDSNHLKNDDRENVVSQLSQQMAMRALLF